MIETRSGIAEPGRGSRKGVELDVCQRAEILGKCLEIGSLVLTNVSSSSEIDTEC